MSRTPFASLGLALLFFGSSLLSAEEVRLKYRVYRDWKITLPAETLTPIGKKVAFPQSCQQAFAVKLNGTALAVDTDGDGTSDVLVRGKQGTVTLRGKTKSGDKFTYAMRLRNAGGWKFVAGGAMVGKIGGQKIQLIDQNGNGRYNEFGKDAMIVGRRDEACFLSEVIAVNGKLLKLEIQPDGTSLKTTPYTGPAGTLDITSRYETDGRLISGIVASVDGKYSFELSRKPSLVPAGEYLLYGGRVALGRNAVQIAKGNSSTFKVADGKTFRLAWGGPINISFTFERGGGKVRFSPELVSYHGQAGEHYVGWKPFGGSPEFQVTDLITGQRIAKAIFGGS